MAETEPVPPAKGAFTSEFWLTVLGVAALVTLVVLDKIDGDWAAGAIAFACFGYSASRAIVKRAQVQGDAEVNAAAVKGEAEVRATENYAEAKVAEFKADLALLATSETTTPPKATRARKAG